MREQRPRIETPDGLILDAGDHGHGDDVVIDFQDVSFAYPVRPGQAILNRFSIQVRRGQTVALVGPSGCGKSTVLALLERFYDPDAGKVRVFGRELPTLNVANYRQSLALVTQEPTLYTGER